MWVGIARECLNVALGAGSENSRVEFARCRNRHPSVVGDLRFRRTIDHHVTFGFGLHFCMGAALARLEGRVALDEVLTRFPEWEVDYDKARRARTSTVRGWETLPVRTS